MPRDTYKLDTFPIAKLVQELDTTHRDRMPITPITVAVATVLSEKLLAATLIDITSSGNTALHVEILGASTKTPIQITRQLKEAVDWIHKQ